MQFTVSHPFSAFIAFFAPRPKTKTLELSQPKSQAAQLSLMIKQQKRINDLVYVCETDENGVLSCKWVKACSISPSIS